MSRVGTWIRRLRSEAPEPLPPGSVVGPARADRRTKNLIPRLQRGDIAVIDHDDLDRVAAEGLLAAGVVAVVNAAPSITGRYPNYGPLVIVEAGVPLLDEVGSDVLDEIVEGELALLRDERLFVDGEELAAGRLIGRDDLIARIEASKGAVSDELERFAENTLDYLRREAHIVTGPGRATDLGFDLHGRHVLIVVRGVDYRDDLEALRRIGYLNELRPVTIGVDGGADALLELGIEPDIILGDFDSVSKDALRSGADLIVHAYPGGTAPGASRLDRLGFEYRLLEAPGTSEDLAMQLAYDNECELIVAVGTHTSMAEFLDKGREGMASTFLTRMKVGSILVDAKGVSRLYQTQVRKRDLLLLVLAALFTVVVIGVVSEPIRLVLRTLWLSLN
ncbi:MAG: putative cytokinetic ring protein SteA [Actinomycetota bacterium]